MAAKRKGRIDDHGRECTKCGEYKPWTEFHRAKDKKTGHAARCKGCGWYSDPEMRARYVKHQRERYANDPEHRRRYLDQKAERYANDPEYRASIRNRELERYANDPEYRERAKERARISKAKRREARNAAG